VLRWSEGRRSETERCPPTWWACSLPSCRWQGASRRRGSASPGAGAARRAGRGTRCALRDQDQRWAGQRLDTERARPGSPAPFPELPREIGVAPPSTQQFIRPAAAAQTRPLAHYPDVVPIMTPSQRKKIDSRILPSGTGVVVKQPPIGDRGGDAAPQSGAGSSPCPCPVRRAGRALPRRTPALRRGHPRPPLSPCTGTTNRRGHPLRPQCSVKSSTLISQARWATSSLFMM
jgi:hypothetical protein